MAPIYTTSRVYSRRQKGTSSGSIRGSAERTGADGTPATREVPRACPARRAGSLQRTLADGATRAHHELLHPLLGALEQLGAVLSEHHAPLVRADRLLERDAPALELGDQRVELGQRSLVGQRRDAVLRRIRVSSVVRCPARDRTSVRFAGWESASDSIHGALQRSRGEGRCAGAPRPAPRRRR